MRVLPTPDQAESLASDAEALVLVLKQVLVLTNTKAKDRPPTRRRRVDLLGDAEEIADRILTRLQRHF